MVGIQGKGPPHGLWLALPKKDCFSKIRVAWATKEVKLGCLEPCSRYAHPHHYLRTCLRTQIATTTCCPRTSKHTQTKSRELVPAIIQAQRLPELKNPTVKIKKIRRVRRVLLCLPSGNSERHRGSSRAPNEEEKAAVKTGRPRGLPKQLVYCACGDARTTATRQQKARRTHCS